MVFGLPKLPPELMEMMKNPAAMGEQIKAFYGAGRALLDAVDQHKSAAAQPEQDMDALDQAVWAAADRFKAEFEKLPRLD